MKTTVVFGLLPALFACKEPIPEHHRAMAQPREIVTESTDTTGMVAEKPSPEAESDTSGAEGEEVFIILPPVSVRESFQITVHEQGEPRKVKVSYEIGKDTTREYAQIYDRLDIRLFPEIPLKLDARVESYISRYRAMNAVSILPLKPIISGNLFSFNLDKLQEDKVFNLVIYEAGRKVHSISFEKYKWNVR